MVGKDGTKYKVNKEPKTLLALDKWTTKFRNKDELVSELIDNVKLKIEPKDISEVKIYMYISSKRNSFGKTLYKKDEMVLNTDAIAAKFELFMLDPLFVRMFIKRYKSIRNFAPLCKTIQAELNNGDEYIDSMTNLGEKVFSTYKGSRNIYFLIKQYELKKTKIARQKELDSVESKDPMLEEDTLMYLNEHERELLDIEDFAHHEELSEFDAHKRL